MKKMAMTGLVIMTIAFACGCATSAKGPTDAEIIKADIDACLAAAKAGDINKVMTYYSEKFQHSQFGDKNGLDSFLTGASGYVAETKFDMSASQTTITGDKATIGPITISGNYGSYCLSFEATKENGVWKITGMDI